MPNLAKSLKIMQEIFSRELIVGHGKPSIPYFTPCFKGRNASPHGVDSILGDIPGSHLFCPAVIKEAKHPAFSLPTLFPSLRRLKVRKVRKVCALGSNCIWFVSSCQCSSVFMEVIWILKAHFSHHLSPGWNYWLSWSNDESYNRSYEVYLIICTLCTNLENFPICCNVSAQLFDENTQMVSIITISVFALCADMWFFLSMSQNVCICLSHWVCMCMCTWFFVCCWKNIWAG